jgi:hypothetical protein
MESTWIEFFKSDMPVTAFHIRRGQINLLCGNAILTLDSHTGKTLQERVLFQKDGKSRGVSGDKDFIYVKDFCDLHILDAATLASVRKLTLGTDLSSDINDLGVDEGVLYVSTRDGSILRISPQTNFEPERFAVSDNGIWSFAIHDSRIYTGNVEGCLLILDKASLEVVERIQASQQNLKSIHVTGGWLISAAQDKKLVVRDLHSLEVVREVRNAHPKAFQIAGSAANQLVTICYACGEIKAWNMTHWTLDEATSFAGGFGQACIWDGRLYVAARNIRGLVYKDLQKR